MRNGLNSIDLLTLSREKPVHFMGIGGAGMAPLAELILRSGGQLTGCDSLMGPAARALEAIGVRVGEGHDPSHVAGCGALIVTAAVPADHPEIQAARSAGIPVLKRAEALGAIVNRGYVVAVAGTHGKTTTTALTTAVLEAAGLDPTAFVGGRVPGWNGNLRRGSDAIFVVEADEYDRSFLRLQPSIAVVTTVEADHLDIFGSLAGVEEAFLTFLDSVPTDGLIVACADESGVGRLIPRLKHPRRSVLTYGLSAGSMLRADDVESKGRETSFTVLEHGRPLGRAQLRIPGTHNVRNALAAIGVARHLNASWSAIAEGLAGCVGVDRRFEEVGHVDDVLVIDDYAHHPTEISATLQAARSSYPERRIVVVFQPHLYSRTRDFAEEFGHSLAAADLLFVTDIYPAREAPIDGVTGQLIVDPARGNGADALYLPDRASVPNEVAAALRPNDLCLTLGAGDLNEAAREVLQLLRRDAKS
ncbi:MAG: UDP-N-acetylmuramate--L-alanine ligase [Gemmatimonas sp.]|nr:UDP-N-acetylmuramate--L-alanine ligase [Gemmatimonas sp.]